MVPSQVNKDSVSKAHNLIRDGSVVLQTHSHDHKKSQRSM